MSYVLAGPVNRASEATIEGHGRGLAGAKSGTLFQPIPRCVDRGKRPEITSDLILITFASA